MGITKRPAGHVVRSVNRRLAGLGTGMRPRAQVRAARIAALGTRCRTAAASASPVANQRNTATSSEGQVTGRRKETTTAPKAKPPNA